LSRQSLSAQTSDKLDFAGKHIAECWAALRDRGFSLTDDFFATLESLRLPAEGLGAPQFFFSESFRELLSCQFQPWSWLHRAHLNCRYHSEYLDWIEAQHRAGAWPEIANLGGKAKTRLDPAFARYAQLKYATVGAAVENALWEAELRKIRSRKDTEAELLFARMPELGNLLARRTRPDVRELLEVVFHATAFKYDAARSNQSGITYSQVIEGTAEYLVCSVALPTSVDSGQWLVHLGIVGKDVKRPILGRDPNVPIAFELELAFPGTRWYLSHEGQPRWVVLGAAFIAAASALLGGMLT
jgi:hypothetical protein